MNAQMKNRQVKLNHGALCRRITEIQTGMGLIDVEMML